MDLSSAIEAKSDQKNADDFLAGPKTFQIERVEVRGGQDQPVWIHLVGEQGKPWKPSKSMTRVLVQAWGPDGDTYAGRFVTLFRDPEIKWAGEAVGGISVAALSHIDKTFSMKLTVSRGKRKPITVQKLEAPEEQPLEVPADVIETATKAHAEGDLEAYKQWLVDKNAPQHIIQAVEKIGA